MIRIPCKHIEYLDRFREFIGLAERVLREGLGDAFERDAREELDRAGSSMKTRSPVSFLLPFDLEEP